MTFLVKGAWKRIGAIHSVVARICLFILVPGFPLKMHASPMGFYAARVLSQPANTPFAAPMQNMRRNHTPIDFCSIAPAIV